MFKHHLFTIAVLVLFVPIEIEAGEFEVGQMIIARNDGAGISLTVEVIEILDNTPRFEIDARFGNPRQVFLNAKLKSYDEFISLYQKIIALDLSKRDEFDGKGGEATFLQFKKNKKSQGYAYYYKKENHPETCAAINKLLFYVQEQLAPNEPKPTDLVVEELNSDKLRTRKEPRTWNSVQGKSIEASFVKLEGKTITLRKEDGSVISFSTELLSEQSIQQAKALDAESK